MSALIVSKLILSVASYETERAFPYVISHSHVSGDPSGLCVVDQIYNAGILVCLDDDGFSGYPPAETDKTGLFQLYHVSIGNDFDSSALGGLLCL